MFKFVQSPNDVPARPVAELDLTRTPIPGLPQGTVRSDVDIFRAEDSAEFSADPYPTVGDEFYGFQLVELLGTGAFGRVYLARERNLANRPVVLKVSLKANNEKLRLARLQHTNIVPIQNAYRRGPYHVIQMPYFGRQTLSDVIDHVRADKGFPKISGGVFTTVAKVTTQQTAQGNSHKDDSGSFQVAEESVANVDSPDEQHSITEVRPLRDLLSGLHYPDAVLAIMSRIADGLAHAHSRGILHLDLKPQNVLLCDDGQPMILDFNLSHDRMASDRKRVGGTWPYMAPELIRHFSKQTDRAPDERTDLYALGVMFYEMLTCRLPFSPVRNIPDDFENAIAERECGLPSIAKFNPDVPAAVESIVHKLCAPNPADRYASVDELREDLKRQFEHLPLRHAPDRHPIERYRKWQRRNPNFIVRAMGVGAVMALTVCGFLFWNVLRTQASTRADLQAMRFLGDHAIARVDLGVPTDAVSRRRGIKTATEWMERFGAGTVANWTSGSAIGLLEPGRRSQTMNALAESAILLAHAEMLESRARTDTDRRHKLESATRWNRLAEECGTESAVSIWEQRSRIAKLLGDKTLQATVPAEFDQTNLTDVDRYCLAVRDIGDGKMLDAIDRLKTLTARCPDHFAGQLMLGLSYQATGQTYRALERLQVAKPLATSDSRPAYHSGLIYSHLGKFAEAEAEFDLILSKVANHAPSLKQRGIVRRRQGQYASAIADFTASKDHGGAAIPLLFYRSDCYARLGNTDAAASDRAESEKIQPVTAEDFTVRAAQIQKDNPSKSLEIYNAAIAADPYYLPAWHNKAYVLSELLNEWDLALATMTKVTELAPSFAPSLAGRAVLLARLKRRAESHAEIQKALLFTADPEILYQASCVYALTSRTNPEDQADALRFFRQSFRDGYRNFAVVENDEDMKRMLESNEFRTVFNAAKNLVK